MAAAKKTHGIDEQAISSRKKQSEVPPAPPPDPQPQAWKKPAPAAEPAASQPAPGTAQPVSAKRPDSVVSPAIKADTIKPPPQQPKKDVRTATSVVSREKEALARLLSSF